MDNISNDPLQLRCIISGNALAHFNACSQLLASENGDVASADDVVNQCLNQLYAFEKQMGMSMADYLGDFATSQVGKIYTAFVKSLIQIEDADENLKDSYVVLITDRNKSYFHSSSGGTKESIAMMIDLLEDTLYRMNR